jgi:hypothetical protein
VPSPLEFSATPTPAVFPPTGNGPLTGGGASIGLVLVASLVTLATGAAFMALGAIRRDEAQVAERVRHDDK